MNKSESSLLRPAIPARMSKIPWSTVFSGLDSMVSLFMVGFTDAGGVSKSITGEFEFEMSVDSSVSSVK